MKILNNIEVGIKPIDADYGKLYKIVATPWADKLGKVVQKTAEGFLVIGEAICYNNLLGEEGKKTRFVVLLPGTQLEIE